MYTYQVKSVHRRVQYLHVTCCVTKLLDPPHRTRVLFFFFLSFVSLRLTLPSSPHAAAAGADPDPVSALEGDLPVGLAGVHVVHERLELRPHVLRTHTCTHVHTRVIHTQVS